MCSQCSSYEKYAEDEEYPTCSKCNEPFVFERFEPFAHCKCGITEWGDGRPENPIYVDGAQEIRGWEVGDTGLLVMAHDTLRLERLEKSGVELRSLIYGPTVIHDKGVCPKCRGNGSWPAPTQQVCPECKGTRRKKDN